MTRALPPIGRFERIDWVETTGSTNDDLAERVRAGDRRPAVLLTEEQTAGRGRRDRRWEMKPGAGLMLSAFVPGTLETTVSLVPMAMSMAARDAVVATDRSVAVKWPNDLVTPDDRKVGGMLGEVMRADGGLVGVVVGLGLNVTWPPSDGTGPPNATSLESLGSSPIDRVALAADLIVRLDRLLDEVERNGSSGVIDAYRAACGTIGRRVRVETDVGAFEGRATDIDSRGALVVATGGEQLTVTVGDVIHLRPGGPDPG